MAIGTYDTLTLIGVQNRQQIDPLFFLQFFPDEITFTTEKVMFDEIAEDRYVLAPFVAPHVEGRVMEKGGFDTRSFKPAYVKPKHDIDVNQQFKRRAGESPVTGTLTPQARYAATIAENFRLERESVERRINWMCAKGMIEGAIIVEGEDYPRATIDFGRDGDLSEVLMGTARWGESGARPLFDLNVKMKRARRLSGGRITDIIMGEEAYDRFYQDDEVRELLNTNYRVGGTAADALILGEADTDKDAELKAVLAGGQSAARVRIWTYAGYYHERDPDTGVLTEGYYLDPNAVVGIGNKMQGVQCFGAIKDPNANLQAMRMFPRIVDKKNDDPAKEYTLTQSAPLPVPLEPNNTFKLQVHDESES
jgi:hypothetical protein